MGQEGTRNGHGAPGQDTRNWDGTGGGTGRATRGQEVTGCDTRWDTGHWDGTGATGMGYEELDMRNWDRDRRHWAGRGHGAPGWDMGDQDWTGATGKGHTRGQEPPSRPPAPFIPYYHRENHPHPTPVGTPPGTYCDPPGKSGYFLEGGFGSTIPPVFPPSGRNCCPHAALPLDLGSFPAKAPHFPGKIPPSGAGGVLEPPKIGRAHV